MRQAPMKAEHAGSRAISPVLIIRLLFCTLEVAYQSPQNKVMHFTPWHDLLAAPGRVDDLILQR